MNNNQYKIITFYYFMQLENLPALQAQLKSCMSELELLGTILIAHEGFNGTITGSEEGIAKFTEAFPNIVELEHSLFAYKASWHYEMPFHKIKVKIKPEIVTLKCPTNPADNAGEYIEPKDWNALITDPEVVTIDTRNEYEISLGTFQGAVNPHTENFSDIPDYVEHHLNSAKHKKIAMFCTGGIRCEKFSSYLKENGFKNVYHLKGGILKYLEEIPESESLWRGKCFVFDDRITVDHNLQSA